MAGTPTSQHGPMCSVHSLEPERGPDFGSGTLRKTPARNYFSDLLARPNNRVTRQLYMESCHHHHSRHIIIIIITTKCERRMPLVSWSSSSSSSPSPSPPSSASFFYSCAFFLVAAKIQSRPGQPLSSRLMRSGLEAVCYMGGCQNYGPFWVP